MKEASKARGATQTLQQIKNYLYFNEVDLINLEWNEKINESIELKYIITVNMFD